jgi:type IV pilus assembly protein PilZ
VAKVAQNKDRRGGVPGAPSPAQPDDDRRTGSERRQFERVLVDLEVDYRADDTFLFAYITDISAMGIFVQTQSPEPIGTRLNLRFNVPGQRDPFELEGEVLWINPYRPGDRENLNPGMGIRFLDLEPAERERLTELVKTFAYLHDDAGKAAAALDGDDDDDGDDDGQAAGEDDDSDDDDEGKVLLDDLDGDEETMVDGRRPGRA